MKKSELCLKIFIIVILFFLKVIIKDNIMFFSLGILISSLGTIFLIKKNVMVLFLCLGLLYLNYSIVVGDYIMDLYNQVNFSGLKYDIYINTKNLKIIFWFNFTFFIFLKDKKIDYKKLKREVMYYDREIFFYPLYIISLLISIIFINRSGGVGYSVRITPLYEYNSVIVLFLYLFSGNKKLKKYLVILLSIFICLQDFYYGGRATSFKFIIVNFFFLFDLSKISRKKIILLMIFGIISMELVATFRTNNFSFNGLMDKMLFGFKKKMYTSDTAVYANKASLGIVRIEDIFSYKQRFSYFLAFLKNSFIGGGNSLTKLANNYFPNCGGGIFPQQLHFFLGQTSLVSGAIFAIFVNRVSGSYKVLGNIYLLLVITQLVRLYLYNPISLTRGVILIPTILYFIQNLIFKVIKKI